MPIYEYKCSACGHQEDHLRKVSDPRLTKCPACGKKKYDKQLTSAGFQLKGSGWYATDFKGGKKPDAAQPEAKAEATTESKSEAKVETKTDAKPDAKSEGKTESKTESTTESKTESKTDTKTDPKTESKADKKTPASTTN